MTNLRSDSQFGGMLKQLRESVGLSQEVLAERSGLSARGISDLELGIRLVVCSAASFF